MVKSRFFSSEIPFCSEKHFSIKKTRYFTSKKRFSSEQKNFTTRTQFYTYSGKDKKKKKRQEKYVKSAPCGRL